MDTTSPGAGTSSIQVDTGAFTLGSTAPEMISDALEQFAEQPSDVSFTECLVMQWARFYDAPFSFGFEQVFPTNGYHLPPTVRT